MHTFFPNFPNIIDDGCYANERKQTGKTQNPPRHPSRLGPRPPTNKFFFTLFSDGMHGEAVAWGCI
jgi:hypothetical protein